MNVVATCRATKDEFVSSLFQPKKAVTPKGPLVEDLDAHSPAPSLGCDSTKPPVPVEKSLLELMMEDQKAAKKEKEALKAKEQLKTSKQIGSGFKKGFFGTKPAIRTPQSSTSKQNNSSVVKNKLDEVVTLSKPSAHISAAKRSDDGLVIDDVQHAMK